VFQRLLAVMMAVASSASEQGLTRLLPMTLCRRILLGDFNLQTHFILYFGPPDKLSGTTSCLWRDEWKAWNQSNWHTRNGRRT